MSDEPSCSNVLDPQLPRCAWLLACSVSRKDASPQSSASARRIPVRILSGNGVHRFRNHCSTSPEYASGIIQLDDVYWGGERRGGKRGRGAAGKTPFVAAVALNKEGHPIKMRMTVVDGFKTKSVADWAKRHIASGSAVISDGLACFKAVKEANCEHLGVVTGGNLDWLDHPAFNWVNTMIGNVKNSLRGSCHTLGAKHLPRHLAEYCFRFNHRFDLKSMLVELGHAVVASPPMPYRLLKLAEGHG